EVLDLPEPEGPSIATTTPVRAGSLTRPVLTWCGGRHRKGVGQALSLPGRPSASGFGGGTLRSLDSRRPMSIPRLPVRRTRENGSDPGRTPDDDRRPPPLARPLHAVCRRPDDRAGRDDRERRAPEHRHGPALLAQRPELGGQRLPGRVRRPAPARGTGGRPGRAAWGLPRRPGRVRRLVPGLRARD